jgi:hypothetical protein
MDKFVTDKEYANIIDKIKAMNLVIRWLEES